jgi:methylated-DNA-[protein]-cysteine S-methyltransferase
MTPTLLYSLIPSPIGPILITSIGIALTGVFTTKHRSYQSMLDSHSYTRYQDNPLFRDTAHQLHLYFKKELYHFQLPLNPAGTVFQQTVWQQLQKVSYGKTQTYKELAVAIGSPKAYRAVGLASSKNPISIIVPCHRVIGSNGALTGYAGGVEVKKTLLEHERTVQEDALHT